MKITASVLAILFATSFAAHAETASTPVAPAPALPLTTSIEVDVSKNTTTDKYVSNTTLKLDFDGKGPAFGGFDIKVTDGTISLGDWQIGTTVASSTVSLGKQGDLFPDAGLEKVGSTTLANPTVNESLMAKMGNLSAMAGFDGLSNDVTDLDNVQVAYDFKVGVIGMGAAVDWNTDTEEKSYGFSSNLDVSSSLSVGNTITYAANKLAYEVNASTGAISYFANGDEDNKLQHVGAGIKGKLAGLDLYAEASYDTDSEDLTPAIGASFKF
jgi:hypothetical protein